MRPVASGPESPAAALGEDFTTGPGYRNYRSPEIRKMAGF